MRTTRSRAKGSATGNDVAADVDIEAVPGPKRVSRRKKAAAPSKDYDDITTKTKSPAKSAKRGDKDVVDPTTTTEGTPAKATKISSGVMGSGKKVFAKILRTPKRKKKKNTKKRAEFDSTKDEVFIIENRDGDGKDPTDSTEVVPDFFIVVDDEKQEEIDAGGAEEIKQEVIAQFSPSVEVAIADASKDSAPVAISPPNSPTNTNTDILAEMQQAVGAQSPDETQNERVNTPIRKTGHASLFGETTLVYIHGAEANEEVRQDIVDRIQKTFLKSHKRPTKFGQVKGSHTKKKATNTHKKFFELAGMSSPEAVDKEGKSTENWPKFQHAILAVDEVIDAPANGIWPKPDDSKATRRLVLGLHDASQKELLVETLSKALEQNMESSDELEVVIEYSHTDVARDVFSREGKARNRPTSNKTVKAATATLQNTPSRNANIDLSML